MMTFRSLSAMMAGFCAFFGLAEARTFLVDFGIAAGNATQGSPTAGPDVNGNYWNNMTSTAIGAPLAGGTGVLLQNLVASDQSTSRVALALSAGWRSSGIGNGGLDQEAPVLGELGVRTATQDYFYVEAANGNSDVTQTVTINYLDPQKSYTLKMFGSRNGTVAPFVRGTRYKVVDANGVHATDLQTTGPDLGGSGYHGNRQTVATLSGLYPTASGTIVLSVSNLHDMGIYGANPFGYLGALAITEGESIEPPALPTARIDFGIAPPGNSANGNPTASPDMYGKYWNNVTSSAVATNIAGGTGLRLSNLVTTDQQVTPWGISLGSGWKSSGGAGFGGLTNPLGLRLGELAIPTATEDYFFVDGGTGTSASLQITGLNPAKLYNFRLFGTRSNSAVRRTAYTLTAGNGVFTNTLQTSGTGIGNGTGGADGTLTYDGNNRNVVTFTGVQVDANGAATLQVAVAEGGFAYLGVMEITEGATVPLLPPVAILDGIDRWTAQDEADPIEPGAVLFVGSSSIRRWEGLAKGFADYRIVQRGFGGSQFSDLNAIVDRIVTPYRPSAIVVFEGTNDIRVGGKTGEMVFTDFQTFVSKVRAELPDVPICYLGITPTPSFFNQPDHDARRRTANLLIEDYCVANHASLNVHFVPTHAYLESLHDTDPAAWMTYFVDDTHLNRAGYEHWLGVVRPVIEALVAPNAEYKAHPGALVAGDKLFFDFGPSDVTNGDVTPSPDVNGNHWNHWHLTNGAGIINSGEHLGNLVRSSGTNTGVKVTITGGFECNGKNHGGLIAPQAGLLGELGIATATEDFFFTSANDVNDGTGEDAPGSFMLEGLNPALEYEFRLFGSRDHAETRITKYTVSGANQAEALLTTSGAGIGSAGGAVNDDEVAVIGGIRPDAYGKVFVDVHLVQGAFAYLNAMQIVVSDPAAASGYEGWRAGHFTALELGDAVLEATLWGADADADGDGRSNLLEYANGTDPRVREENPQRYALEEGGQLLTLTYQRHVGATDVTFQVQKTDDLETWLPVSDVLVSTDGLLETRKASVSKVGVSRLWLRLKVELAN